MKGNIKSFVSGCIVTAAVVGLVGSAAATVGQKTVALDYNDIKVTLDGKQVTLVDSNGQAVEPFAIDGTTYLPVRAVSDALGLEVGWDGRFILHGQARNTTMIAPAMAEPILKCRCRRPSIWASLLARNV